MSNLGRLWRKTNQTKNNLWDRGEIRSLFNFADTTYLVRVTRHVLETKNIAGNVGIYGHGSFGIYGTAEYGSVASGSFILGHVGAGILGTSKLGSQSSSWEIFASANLTQKLTNVGRTQVRDWLAGSGNNQPLFTAVGSGNTAFALTDTALESELTGERNSITTATGAKLNTFQTEWDSLEATGNTFREFGLFTATANGNMYSRTVFASGLSKTNLLEARYTQDWTYTNTKPMMDAGIQVIRDWAAGSTTESAPTHMAWGSGGTATDVTDTTMQAEQERNILTATGTSVTRRADFTGVLAASEATGVAITRTALFNANSNGAMTIHAENPSIAKTSRFDITTVHRITID